MRAVLVLLPLCLGAVTANVERIVGGSTTTISRYPAMAALLFNGNSGFRQACGGTILSTRSILTAAHCPHGDAISRWRVRVGSTNANSGGVVHTLTRVIIHPNFNSRTRNNDIAIMRVTSSIRYVTNAVQPARYASSTYVLFDGTSVRAVGWGRTTATGSLQTQLRHVSVNTVTQASCRTRYANIGRTVTANMLCTGNSAISRGTCTGDFGGPIYHNNVLVGVISWGEGCGRVNFPGVNARVSNLSSWIRNNI